MMYDWKVPIPCVDGKKIILVDMDNTILDINSALAQWAAARHEIPIDLNSEDYHVNTWHPSLKLDEAFAEKSFFLNLKPFPYAIEAILALAKHHHVIICSAPNSHVYPFSADEKTRWMRKNLPSLKLILCDDKTLIFGEFLLDDNPHIRKKGLYKDAKWEHVYFAQSYNINKAMESIEDCGIIRNWEDILKQCL